ncbi:glycosyltransferase [Streptomyces diastatochromogenes]|nr:glycosyltransferase [Streptomyces diastatochromogenes]
MEMAALVHQELPEARFTLYGPDDGSLPAVRRLIADGLTDVVHYGGALDPADAREAYRTAAVHVLASVNEPFGMTVIEAMAAGTPVVLTDTCGIADELARRGAAVVTDGTPRPWRTRSAACSPTRTSAPSWPKPAGAWSRTCTRSAPWWTGWRRTTGEAAEVRIRPTLLGGARSRPLRDRPADRCYGPCCGGSSGHANLARRAADPAASVAVG